MSTRGEVKRFVSQKFIGRDIAPVNRAWYENICEMADGSTQTFYCYTYSDGDDLCISELTADKPSPQRLV